MYVLIASSDELGYSTFEGDGAGDKCFIFFMLSLSLL